MKKKGFTLIELLAVIIILAVIALIATPTILNVVENARRSSFQQSANGYYDAARYLYDELYLNNDRQDILFTFEEGEQTSSNEGYKLQVKGEKPKGGVVYLSSDGQIMVSIHNGKYCAITDGTGKVTISEDIENCVQNIAPIPESCFSIVNDMLLNGFGTLDYSEDWMNASYNMLYYGGGCPTDIDLLVIPNEVNGEKVEGIVSYFADGLNIKNLIIPDSVKIIDDGAFMSGSLTQVIFPKNLIYIGSEAFDNNQLTNVKIPDSVTYIAGEAFIDNQLTSVTIPEGVTTIEAGAFQNNQIKNITIPDSVTYIGGSAFTNNQLPDNQAFIYKRNSDGTEDKTTIASYGGAKRDNVIIPEGVTTIEDYAFSNNQLTNITIPDSVTKIEVGAFRGNQLTSVTIPDSVTYIGGSAFENNQLTSVIIPEGVTTIGSYAFSNNQLTSVTIPSSVTSIGYRVFSDNQLTSIIIPNSVTSIEKFAFNNNQLPDNQAFIYKRNSDGSEDKTTIVSYGGAKRDNVIIPEGVTTIEDYAFSNNQLTSITIPSSVTSIGYQTFHDNKFPNASAITIEGDTTRFDTNWTSIGFPAK